MAKFVDASGFPVEPSGPAAPQFTEYWYRPDVREADRSDDPNNFWGSPRWMAVQAILNNPNYPKRKVTRNGETFDEAETWREIAFEV